LVEQLLPGWLYQGQYGENSAYQTLVDAVEQLHDELEVQIKSRYTRREKLIEE